MTKFAIFTDGDKHHAILFDQPSHGSIIVMLRDCGYDVLSVGYYRITKTGRMYVNEYSDTAKQMKAKGLKRLSKRKIAELIKSTLQGQ